MTIVNIYVNLHYVIFNYALMKYIITIFFIVVGFIWYQIDKYQDNKEYTQIYNSSKKELLSQDQIQETQKKEVNIIPQSYAQVKISEKKPEKKELKINANLDVDFFSQSPLWEWWPIFNETCEEASALIAINYVRDNKMNKEEFKSELLKMVDYENKTFWDYKHTNVDQTSQILKEYFKFDNYNIIEEPTIKEIKTTLNNWNIIIAPFYWIWLNPNYTWIWPEYHFIVIKGYTGTQFITHDVWTKLWANYHYDQEKLLERLHDYDTVSVQNWKKRLIVLKK